MANADITPTSTLNCGKSMEYYLNIHNWDVKEVVNWVRSTKIISSAVMQCLEDERIDGEVLLSLSENDIYDMRYRFKYQISLSDIKRLWLSVNSLQTNYYLHHGNDLANLIQPRPGPVFLQQDVYNKSTKTLVQQHLDELPVGGNYYSNAHKNIINCNNCNNNNNHPTTSCNVHILPNAIPKKRASINTQAFNLNDILSTNNPQSSSYIGECNHSCSSPCSAETSKHIPPELFKTLISLGYSFLVTWITSFVMVIVHERVPDMKRYPPLPDIFLDNVPHIPWAFHMCEITGTLLFAIWTCVIVFHKYRTVLLRRFFALAGTVFLLRCVTMLITSLSVPGSHLQCDQNDYAIDDTHLSIGEALEIRITRAYIIWSGLGMSIQGVRTCGDYMFSGHTVALTLLNFFITEYTPRNLYFLHTLTWLLNMFGIFFILAAHEHYSIDVFVAFYITSRLFLYYHTLANNQALMSHDSNRTRVWFPMFSYFESSVEGIVPNEYDSIESMSMGIINIIMEIKEACMLTTRRIWLYPQNFQNMQNIPIQARRFLHMTRVPGFTTKPIERVATTTAATSISNIYDIPNTTPSQRSSNSNASLLSSYWLAKMFNAQECTATATTAARSNDSEIHVAKKQN